MWRLASISVVAAITALALGGANADDQPRAGKVIRVAAPKRIEVHVPAGRFWMGVSDDDAVAANEQCIAAFPAVTGTTQAGVVVDFCASYLATLTAMKPRNVYVGAFAIDRDEASVDDYRSCVAAGACDLDPLVGGDERYIKPGWPMVNVTWFEAQDYCRWRGGRLPTEAEWERAARGDNAKATWPWGDLEQPKDFNHGQPRAQAMREIDRTQLITPVQFFGDPDDSDGTAILAKPGTYVWGEGPYGTRDQAGNVAEWTADAWVLDAKIQGYEGLDRGDPLRSPALLDPRVVRGGSWRQPIFVARANLRDPFNKLYLPNQRFSHIGFRCARSTAHQNDATHIAPPNTSGR